MDVALAASRLKRATGKTAAWTLVSKRCRETVQHIYNCAPGNRTDGARAANA